MEKLDFLEMCNIYYKSRNELLHGGFNLGTIANI